jgi:hypothetical protein
VRGKDDEYRLFVVSVVGVSLPTVAESTVVVGAEASPDANAVATSSPVELVPPTPAKLGRSSMSVVDPVRGRPERVGELVGERTASSSTFVMSDGTRQWCCRRRPCTIATTRVCGGRWTLGSSAATARLRS